MKLRLSKCKWSKLLVGAALVAALVVLAGGHAQASNMGFKMNKVIDPKATNPGVGQNLVAIPYRNPYMTAEDLCAALGLTASQAKVIQNIAQTGASLSHTCSNASPFSLRPREGFLVNNQPTTTGGILVGSHQANPPGSVTLYPSATNPGVGVNFYDLPYHTTNLTAEDVCNDLGLPANSKVIRNVAATGASLSFLCGGGSPFTLVLGEALKVTSISGGLAITPAAGHPAHF
ncbi:MAG TPA: hypothetical protein VGK94_10275 [Candidatus Polarisedimenticolia bacterium]|jgi:hypothetical protein